MYKYSRTYIMLGIREIDRLSKKQAEQLEKLEKDLFATKETKKKCEHDWVEFNGQHKCLRCRKWEDVSSPQSEETKKKSKNNQAPIKGGDSCFRARSIIPSPQPEIGKDCKYKNTEPPYNPLHRHCDCPVCIKIRRDYFHRILTKTCKDLL